MDIREGTIELSVPGTSEEAIEEDVFYNPNQVLNRDLTIGALRAYRQRDDRAQTYLDAMAASGVRGIRAAADGWDVTLCDRDADAVALARENLEQNGLDGTVIQADTNAHIHESVYDVIDLDPFGSPIPFADAALSTARNLVAVTATDTAPLCGAHFNAGRRRYDAIPQNTEYHPEMGLRILLSALARTAARYDRAVTPLFSHVTRHYVRVYLELDSGAQRADTTFENLGYLYHCPQCLHRTTDHSRFPSPPAQCPNCGHDGLQVAGPLWLAPVRDRSFTAALRSHLTDELDTAAKASELTETIEAEVDQPTHYDQHRLSKAWGRPAIAMDEFLDQLRAAGFAASRAHYSGTAFKTDATVAQIRAATSV